ncbi:hypothetical protein VP01_1334g1 [Puccinia sorghi]|uniref:Uncharacterized protein n=1 Tax=Puccinia sorghi TaxID=27349 RepID=A0A0L6VP50_9BASI|nr:hypothetical protein VP01_1334g1 [Puccinia sorghi]
MMGPLQASGNSLTAVVGEWQADTWNTWQWEPGDWKGNGRNEPAMALSISSMFQSPLVMLISPQCRQPQTHTSSTWQALQSVSNEINIGPRLYTVLQILYVIYQKKLSSLSSSEEYDTVGNVSAESRPGKKNYVCGETRLTFEEEKKGGGARPTAGPVQLSDSKQAPPRRQRVTYISVVAPCPNSQTWRDDNPSLYPPLFALQNEEPLSLLEGPRCFLARQASLHFQKVPLMKGREKNILQSSIRTHIYIQGSDSTDHHARPEHVKRASWISLVLIYWKAAFLTLLLPFCCFSFFLFAFFFWRSRFSNFLTHTKKRKFSEYDGKTI